ncbi:MAG: hypothetical protein OXG85_06405 [Chloroflexi bacterium]|nr:hypothetical protein [Chloroflexota bacterium]
MEFFMAEQIMYRTVEKVESEWSGYEDNLIDKLRCVQGVDKDGKDSPDFLDHSVSVAGNIMGNMMAQELMKLLLPPDVIAGIVENAIERAIKDEEYDREHKEPEEYEIPLTRERKSRRPNESIRVAVSISPLP